MATFKVITRKNILVFTLVLVLSICIGVGALGIRNAFSESKRLPVYSTDSKDKIAISFDASWGADKTKAIVDLLSGYGITATFFLTGIWIDAFPEQVKYIAEKGFEIGNHSKNHYNMTGLNVKKINQEIDYVNDKVKELTGIVPKVFRAPFGAYDDKLIKCLDKKNMTCVQWSIDSLDWKGLGKEELKERIIPNLKGGSIILCHNNSDHILEALPEIIESALSKGLRFVNMSELIYTDNYVIDNNGKQSKKSNGGEL